MEILYLLVPLSVALVFAIGAVFWFALQSGQFDDLEGAAVRVLADDDSSAGASASFDLGQKPRPDARYDGTLAARGPAEPQEEKHGGTGDV
ncbi:MAG TPA: cbb3-type cytochrome oxidase assembly protein CcoS [Burkholderiales bacterium]